MGGGGVSSSALSASLNLAGRNVSRSVVLGDTFLFFTISLSAPSGQLRVLFYQPVELSGEVIPSNALPVGQTLACYLFNGDLHPLPVLNVTIIPTELKL